MQWTIREEMPDDREAIRHVHTAAFDTAAEANLVDALRDSHDIRLSLMAINDREVVGHILFSRMWIDQADESIEALALAPLAVLPQFQRQGVGTALTVSALDYLKQAGHGIVLVVGHPEFYGRFGFIREPAQRLQSPYQCEAFLALELRPCALDGVRGKVRYAAPFQSL